MSALVAALLSLVLMPGGQPAAFSERLADPLKLTERAPDLYLVEFTTSRGVFVVEVRRPLAPLGADRFYNLVQNGFYDETRFFRVIPDYVALFGIHGDPEVSARWVNADIKDDPVRTRNRKGTLVFATAGPNTRTTQVFINLRDNVQLDGMGFAPFGRVTRGMDVVMQLESGYGDRPPRGNGPRQERIRLEGNAYLKREFPELDYIIRATVFNPGGGRGSAARSPEERPGGETK